MDNKKWYKKISTCFWFFLATMPIIIPLIMTICRSLIHTDGLDFNEITSYINLTSYYANLDEFINNMGLLLPTSISSVFSDVFQSFEVGGYQALGFICGWFVWAYIIELLVDIIVWLPRLFHKWLDRWCY